MRKIFKQTEILQLFHAGTIKDKNGIIRSNGGRVLNSTVISKTLKKARDDALNVLNGLDWENKYYRKDIGFKAINK